jgi:hypothetical protein
LAEVSHCHKFYFLQPPFSAYWRRNLPWAPVVQVSLNKFLIVIVAILSGLTVWLTWRDFGTYNRFSSATSVIFRPGQLSRAHAFLATQCTSCHTPNHGVTSAGCISCHANNTNLLQRQSTAFHANIVSCGECHLEHRGGLKPPLHMDHFVLAKLGQQSLVKVSSASPNQLVSSYLNKKRVVEKSAETVSINPNEPPLVSALNCVSCHSTRDQHQGYFGNSCLSCHSTQSWSIAEYQHPSPNSRDCNQCHKPPPSHSMMHFEMVSKIIAGHKDAQMNQCFLCHQTSSFNDIKGVGWYKHH